MFTRETAITMFDGHAEQIGRLASLGDATLIVRTKKGAGPSQYVSFSGDNTTTEGATEVVGFQTTAGDYVELTTKAGLLVKCAPRAKLCLAGGGFAYAEESSGAVADTENGPDTVQGVNRSTGDLVSIRLSTVHAVLAGSLWFLTE